MKHAILARHADQAEVEILKGGNKKEQNRVITWFKQTHGNKINILIMMKKVRGAWFEFL